MAKDKVILKVGSKPYILRLGFNGLIELEEILEKPITEISEGGIEFRDLRTIFYVAIKHGGKKDLTMEETGDILDTVMEDKGINYMSEVMTELFENMVGGSGESFPDTKK